MQACFDKTWKRGTFRYHVGRRPYFCTIFCQNIFYAQVVPVIPDVLYLPDQKKLKIIKVFL